MAAIGFMTDSLAAISIEEQIYAAKSTVSLDIFSTRVDWGYRKVFRSKRSRLLIKKIAENL